MCEIEQAGLLRSLCYLSPQAVLGFQQLLLDPPPHRAEPRKKAGKQNENQVVGQIRGVDIETEAGLSEEIIEGKAGEYYRQDRRPYTGVPDGHRNSEQVKRVLHTAKVVAVQKKRDQGG
jgi:hypothetical protein